MALRRLRGTGRWMSAMASSRIPAPQPRNAPKQPLAVQRSLATALEYLDKINGYTAEAENEDGVGKLFDFARAVFKTKRKGKERKGEDKGD